MFPDRMVLLVLAALYLLIYVVDLGTRNFTNVTLALSSIGLVIFPILYFLNKEALKYKFINITMVLLHVYLILIMKARTIILEGEKG